MAENSKTSLGVITQIVGAVLDIRFQDGNLPEINEAIHIKRQDGDKLVVEVAQHLGDDTVRCIAMGPTDGLVRGMEAVATGAPICVPVGEETLGRMFNVLGEPIDEKEPPKVKVDLRGLMDLAHPLDGVQRVVQEVGVELGLHHADLSLVQLPLLAQGVLQILPQALGHPVEPTGELAHLVDAAVVQLDVHQ